MKATLLAKSSHGEPYKVEFSAEDSTLRVFCHCQAGVLHRMCKHNRANVERFRCRSESIPNRGVQRLGGSKNAP